eukprot:10004631-Heterocapsa_arctica.AAC.1
MREVPNELDESESQKVVELPVFEKKRKRVKSHDIEQDTARALPWATPLETIGEHDPSATPLVTTTIVPPISQAKASPERDESPEW